MAWVAISWLAIDLSHGRNTGLLVGAAVAAYTLPGVVAGLGLSRVLAHFDPRQLILFDACLRLLCLGAVAATASVGVLNPPVFVLLLGISSLFGLLEVTGYLTTVVEMLPPEQHVAGNSLITVAVFASSIVGPAAAGGIVAAFGPGAAVGADALSYVALALAIVVSRRLQAPPPVAAKSQSVLRALRSLRRHPAILGITLLSVVFFGLYGPVEVALPVYVAHTLRAGPGLLGGFFSLFAVGATVGALASTLVQRFGIWRVALLVMIGWGLCLVAFGFFDSIVVSFVTLAVGGLIYGPFEPLKQTVVQRYSPPSLLPSLAAGSALLTVPASPLGTAAGGPIVAALGPGGTILWSGLATIAAALLAWGWLLGKGRRARFSGSGYRG